MTRKYVLEKRRGAVLTLDWKKVFALLYFKQTLKYLEVNSPIKKNPNLIYLLLSVYVWSTKRINILA